MPETTLKENELRWRRYWSDVAWNDSEKLHLIGFWQDIVGYYASESGTVWKFHCRSVVNCGELSEFAATFRQRRRGVLLSPAA